MLERELAWLKEHLPQLDSPVVFCHNDLLCKNIIYDSSKGTASRPRGGRAPAAPSAAWGVAPQAGAGLSSLGCRSSGGCWASKGRPSAVGLKL